MSTCPKPTPQPCPPSACPPPPPKPPCLVKPVMRGLHWAQTKRVLTQAILLSMLGGACVYTFIGIPRKRKYQEYYLHGEFEEWGSEMAKKGLFQSVPQGSEA